MRKTFPAAEVVILQRLGHYPHIEDPDTVAGHLLPFLRDQIR